MVTTYSIRDLAKEFDLTTRAMRFYEDMGLRNDPQRTFIVRKHRQNGKHQGRLKSGRIGEYSARLRGVVAPTIAHSRRLDSSSVPVGVEAGILDDVLGSSDLVVVTVTVNNLPDFTRELASS